MALGLCWCCLVPASAQARPPALELGALGDQQGAPLRLRLSADHLSYLPNQGLLELAGKVRVTAGELRVRSARLEVKLDGEGHPLWLEAAGTVAMELARTRGVASKLRLALGAKRTVELVGDARLQLPALGVGVTGSRIRIDLATGRFTVQEATARLRGSKDGG
jgi:lipopolysaccharide export system protein LptA